MRSTPALRSARLREPTIAGVDRDALTSFTDVKNVFLAMGD